MVSVDGGRVGENGIGVVCYVGNGEGDVSDGGKYSEENDGVYGDYGKCSDGVVVCLKNGRDEGMRCKMFDSGK